MVIETSQRVKDKLALLNIFMQEHIYPNEGTYASELASAPERFTIPPIMEKLKRRAHEQGLWNLFLANSIKGPGLSNLEYAPFCEIMGRSLIAPEVFNCSAPDTGNMDVLDKYGTKEQKDQWLKPLMAGEIRSCFAMTEPGVASSDATNIACSIKREGDYYLVNGRKWWTSGALDKRCRLAIVMGKSNPEAESHHQQSMLLVPMDTPGLTVVRPLTVFGFDDAPHGHGEVDFINVKVPLANILLGEGRGFEIAQGRLGPGRIHHCMRSIGAAERALELMITRAGERTAFGSKLIDKGVIRQYIAQSRIEIDQARLLTLKAAQMMDAQGNKEARLEIAMIKVVAPNVALAVIDRAIQVHGAGGLSQDYFLAHAYAMQRALRLADGPDEVHMEAIAKSEIARQQAHSNKSS